jgi:hypothetical protein
MKTLTKTLIAAALLLSAGAASAADVETPWAVFKKVGLTGNWSPDCSAPPSKNNFWMTYKKGPGGKVTRPMNRGNGDELSVTVDSASLLPNNNLAARFRNDDPTWKGANNTAVDLVMEIVNGRARTLVSKGTDGTEYIKDGIVVASGKPIPWIEKCGAVMPKPAPAADPASAPTTK